MVCKRQHALKNKILSLIQIEEYSIESQNHRPSYVNGVLTPKNFNANDKNDIIDEFGTIIHESIHHKNSIHGIYIDAEHYIEYTNAEKIDTRSFFNFELIAVVLPADAKEKIIRIRPILRKVQT